MGNLTELVIALTALRAGQYMLVKASVAGAIVTNGLFMLGMSFLIGGLRYRVQEFNRSVARLQATLLLLASVALLLPSAIATWKMTIVPHGLQNLLEWIVEGLYAFFAGILGVRGRIKTGHLRAKYFRPGVGFKKATLILLAIVTIGKGLGFVSRSFPASVCGALTGSTRGAKWPVLAPRQTRLVGPRFPLHVASFDSFAQ